MTVICFESVCGHSLGLNKSADLRGAVTTEKEGFTIRASSSRLEKGLIAIPQRFNDRFPRERGPIQIVFDDEQEPRALTFHPYDPVVKESRIFGLGHWFSRRGVREGDQISITLEDVSRRLYRIALDRYVREREEEKTREKLHAARTDSEAEQEIDALSRMTKRRPRAVAHDELTRIALESIRRPRPKIPPGAAERHEGVPSGIRVLLRELHDGKCQLCSFTFEKPNGEPYFEVHHLDPEIGHHPTNLLVLCPNCHAQFERATVTDFRWVGNWLVGVTINGKRFSIRQPLVHDSIRRALLGFVILVAAAHLGRLLAR
jgi:5-methylcytosine-specific restriction endonuclease McrA